MSSNNGNLKRFLVLCVSTVILLVACVFLNINMRDSISEDDYQMVNVLVLSVGENYTGTKQYSSEKSITVRVSYKGEETKLKSVPGSKYSYYKNNIHKMIPVCLYKGSLYSAPENIITTAGGIYFACLGLFVLSFILTIRFRPKKKCAK